MKYTPEEIAELLKDKPHQPHYIAAMVRKAVETEREACAKLCEQQNQAKPEHPEYGSWGEFDDCAELIRSR